jgi:hypothetical protein
MEHLQTRLDAPEQQMLTVTRRLRWWGFREQRNKKQR